MWTGLHPSPQCPAELNNFTPAASSQATCCSNTLPSSHADQRYHGLRGVVVRDTANTLQLITPDNRFVVVPKQVGQGPARHAALAAPTVRLPGSQAPHRTACAAMPVLNNSQHTGCCSLGWPGPTPESPPTPYTHLHHPPTTTYPSTRSHHPFSPLSLQLCTWEFDADRRRVVTLLGPGLARRGTGTAGSTAKPKTLREAIRSQQRG